MTDEQRRAYFRKTAPVEDMSFVLRIFPQLGPMPGNPTKRDAMRLFDRARALDTAPANDPAFWMYQAELIARAEAVGILPKHCGNWPPHLSLIEESERVRKVAA